MKRNVLTWGALLGALTGLTVTALIYLGWRLLGLSFLPFDIFDWMARVLPGPLISFVIDLIVKSIGSLNLGPTASTAKLIEQAIAIVQFILAGAIFGLVLGVLGGRSPQKLLTYGAYGGGILWATAILIEIWIGFPGIETGSLAMIFSILWLGVVLIGWGVLLARLLFEIAFQPADATGEGEAGGLTRRQFLYLVGTGSAAVIVSAVGVGLAAKETRPSGTAGPTAGEGSEVGAFNTSGPAQSPPKDVLAARIQLAPGTRPELTSNQDFYRIDINTVPPEVNGETWRLELGGLVDKPLTLSLEEIRARSAISQVITLECISNQVGGDLISTARFTGVPLKELLAEAGMKSSATGLHIEAVDGFYETVAMEDMIDERTLLVYEMNGEPLPVEHGYPLRIYIPNRFGMKQPKWITRMQVIDQPVNQPGSGYWEDRGWSEQAIVKTTSVIDAIDTSGMDPNTNIVPVGGIAYAGARGISKVEVKFDDGPWQTAELRDPPLSSLAWVQWRYDWQAKIGRHLVSVRAYDGTGALQETKANPPFPDGATGIDTKNAVVLS